MTSTNKTYIILSVALSALLACQSPKQEAPADSDPVAEVSQEPDVNSLTEEQKAQGWKLLFDGQTTNGWKMYQGKENDSWEVVDGTLHCKPFETSTRRADIMTVEQYENFELIFDWKISFQGNSGVMFRVTEDFVEPYLTGPEYQVIDDEGYPGDLKDTQLTGSTYDMYAASNQKINPIGEWNTSKLIANGNHIEHWLNGSKVLEYEINSADWKKRKAGSKWNEAASYGIIPKGYIDLQDHKNEVWFRNILIRTL